MLSIQTNEGVSTVSPSPMLTVAPTKSGWLPNDLVMEAFYRGETGDAEILAALYAGHIAYDHSEREWYFFEGHAWKKDRCNQLIHLVTNNVASQYIHAAAVIKGLGVESQEETVKELIKRAGVLRFKGRIDRVLALAASQPTLSLTGDEWHSDTLLIACPNGVLDLRDGSFRDGRPEDYLRTTIPTEWKGSDEPAPRWEKFLCEIFANDTDLIDFVQRLFGYGLTGLSSDDKFPILWGEGRNGKDTMFETIEEVLGNEMAAPVQSEIIISAQKNPHGATPTLIAMRNRRIVWVSETDEGTRINGAQVKLLTGGGTIAARQLHKEAIVFKPTHLIMLMTNHKPHTGDDDALWKRLLLIEFSQRFVDEPIAPNEHPCDTMLSAKLKLEASGILAWVVKGVKLWQEQGLKPPRQVTENTNAYRKHEDTINQFLVDCCEMGEDYSDGASYIFNKYREWSEENGFGKGMSSVAFGERMVKRFTRERDMRGIKYRGLRVIRNTM